MRILVTGAGGLVGCHLIKKLSLMNISYIPLISPRTIGKRPWTKYLLDMNKVVAVDLRDYNSLKATVKKLDFNIVIHLAAVPYGKQIYNINYGIVKNLLNAISHCGHKIERFIFVSSLLALGDSLCSKFDEYTSGKPKTDYEKSKYNAENFIIENAGRCNYKYTIFRPSWIYGEYSINPDILPLIKLIKKHILIVPISKDIPISPIYAGDVADMIIQSITDDIGGIYHIRGPHMYTLGELLDTIKNILNVWTIDIYIPKIIVKLAAKWVNILRYLLLAPPEINMDKWINSGGKPPKTKLYEGLEKTIKWYIDMKML